MSIPEKSALLRPGAPERIAAQPARRGWVLDWGVFLRTVLPAGILVYLVCGIAHSYGRRHPAEPAPRQDNLCLTPACVHASSEILYNLSPDYKNIDPCTDFEELVCGGWKDRHDLRPDQGAAFTGTLMYESSQLLLRHILEADYPKDSSHSYFSPIELAALGRSTDEANFKLMKDAYNACLDEESIKKLGVSPLKKILNEVEETFPIKASSEKIKDAILLLAGYEVSAIVSTGTGPDDRSPDNVVVGVSAPWRIGLPSKERYEDKNLVVKYRDVLVNVLGALYPERDHETFEGVVEFEKRLAAASPSEEERNNVTATYNPMSLQEADELAPLVGLKDLISDLVPSGELPDWILVSSPKYVEAVDAILSETPSDVLQGYFLWKCVQSFAPYVMADEVKPYQRFLNELQGKDPDSEPDRWRTCVEHIDSGLGWILSRFFVEKAFSARAKELGDTIVLDIKDEFIKKLKAAEWMDDESTKLAIEKVHNIIQKIGYPTKSPDVMDPDSLAKYYSGLEVSPDAFFQNAVRMRQLEVNKTWSALGKPVDRDVWDMTVPEVNAYYNPPGNEIVFPAGIMQFPVFDVDVPAYLSYGAFGSVAGHELSHAFDSTGRHYSQDGSLADWWTNATVEAFERKAQCFVDQYSNFTVPGPNDKPLHVNGKLTLGENIADAGGLSASFQAWKKRADEKPDQDLPGLDQFTQSQLFFVSYSNWWCGVSRKDEAINRIYTDPHAPKWARILGTMSNSREFRESFQCQNKEPTCELW